MAAYHEVAGARSLVFAMSHPKLIASRPPSRPRHGTTSCTVTASLTRGLCVLRMFGHYRLFDGGRQQIATTAIVPFNTGLWPALLAGVLCLVWWVAPDSEESSFRPDGMGENVASLTGSRFFYSIRRRFDERLLRRSFARSRELHCVLPLDNEVDLAGWRTWKA